MSNDVSVLKAVLVANATEFKAGMAEGTKALFNFKMQIDNLKAAIVDMQGRIVTETRNTMLALGGLALAAKPLEDAMGDVSTLVDTSSTSMSELQQKIIDVANTLKASPTDVAKSYYQVLSAGITDASTSFDVLTAAGKLAKGGLASNFEVVDLLTTAINAYGISAKDATLVGDQFMVTIREGKTTAAELASSFGNVAPLAKQAGLAIDELNAATVTMTKQGIATAQAHTSMRAALQAVIAPSEQAKKTAKSLGIDFSTAGLKAKGFAGFMKDVFDKTKGNTEAMSKLFGSVEALNGVMALSGDKLNDYKLTLNKLSKSAGELDKAFQKQLHPINTLINNVKNLGIEIGTRFLPILNALLTPINILLDWLHKLNPTVKSFLIYMSAVLAILWPFRFILAVVTLLFARIGIIIPPLMAILRVAIPFILRGIAFIVPWLIRAVPFILDILGLTNPIFLGIMAIVGAIILVSNNFMGLRDLLGGVMSTVFGWISEIYNSIVLLLKQVIRFEVIENLLYSIIGLIQYALSNIILVASFLTSQIMPILANIKTFIVNFINDITYLASLIQQIMSFLPSVGVLIAQAFSGTPVQLLIDLVNQFINQLGQLGELGAAIKTKFLLDAQNVRLKQQLEAIKAKGKAQKQFNIGIDAGNAKLKKTKDHLSDINRLLEKNFKLAVARAWANRGKLIEELTQAGRVFAQGKSWSQSLGSNINSVNAGQSQIVYQFNIGSKTITLEGVKNPTAQQRKAMESQAKYLYYMLDRVMGNESIPDVVWNQ